MSVFGQIKWNRGFNQFTKKRPFQNNGGLGSNLCSLLKWPAQSKSKIEDHQNGKEKLA
jgi:hypothetical protein